jgi:hypothetical protein
MAHPRKLIRDDTATRLGAITFAGQPVPVHKMRFLPTAEAALPCLCVYTLRLAAQAAGAASGAMQFKDTLTLAVEVIVASHGDAVTEDELDALCEAVENCLLQDPDWLKVNFIESVEGIDTDIQSGKIGAKRRHLAARLSFRVTYRTVFQPAPLGTLDQLAIHVATLDPRDTSQPFPPEDWQETPHAIIALPPPT